mgnify:CR=1 FL=1
MRQMTCKVLALVCFLCITTPERLRSQEDGSNVIFSISQSFPMRNHQEKAKKNFYVNMGENQGLQKGTVLDVFRTFSRRDPYDSKERYRYTLKIGELKVIHVERNRAVAKLSNFSSLDEFYLENEKFMIGDKVAVNLK